MILREFIYVDSEKVRGLLAQLDEGISESTAETTHSEKNTGAGLKGLAAHSQKWGSQTVIQKSLGDVLFPTLEQTLESFGLLEDLSEQLQDEDFWGDAMREKYPPGTLVRITAPGSFFDARFLASSITAFATAWQGLISLGTFEAAPTAPVVPPKKTSNGAMRSQKPKTTEPFEGHQLEDDIPKGDLLIDGEVTSRETLVGIVRVARGMFTPGLHLNLKPSDSSEAIVSARLQEGRQFLDTDPEILYARYGASEQDWTLVGSIGTYGKEPLNDDEEPEFITSNESVIRASFADFVNNFLLKLADSGFADLPREPSFSIVPLAVYRVVGSSLAPSPTQQLNEPTE